MKDLLYTFIEELETIKDGIRKYEGLIEFHKGTLEILKKNPNSFYYLDKYCVLPEEYENIYGIDHTSKKIIEDCIARINILRLRMEQVIHNMNDKCGKISFYEAKKCKLISMYFNQFFGDNHE